MIFGDYPGGDYIRVTDKPNVEIELVVRRDLENGVQENRSRRFKRSDYYSFGRFLECVAAWIEYQRNTNSPAFEFSAMSWELTQPTKGK